MNQEELMTMIVDSAIEVHRTLGGSGLLESVYEEALCFELRQRHVFVERQIGVPLNYKGQALALFALDETQIWFCNKFWRTLCKRWNSSDYQPQY